MEVENFFGTSYSGSKGFSQHDVPKANASGFGAAADDYMERGIDLNEQLIRNKPATFFMKVNSDSMAAAGITTGDIAIIDRSVQPISGKIIIAVVDGEMLLRRYESSFNKMFLISESYKTIRTDVSQKEDFKIWGVLVWVIKEV